LDLKVIPVQTGRERREFIRLPYRLHRRYDVWVPPLISEVKATLDPRKNPFFEHASGQLFIVRRGRKTVGRIAAIVDRNFIEVRGEMIGLFGFFDAVDDPEVAAALFNTASKWLREEGMKRMLGPTNPSMNDELGVLINAFDLPPAVKMVWNPPYYPALYEQAGFTKAMDLQAWMMHKSDVSERLLKAGELIKKRTKVAFRHPDLKNFDREIDLFREVYNRAWSNNWGFVPWTEAEFKHVAKSLKQVIDPDLVFVAEIDGRAVGFSLTLPDINQALIHLNGRLFPFGLVKLLWFARKIDRARVVILGVLPEYRRRGIDTVMYAETVKIGPEKGYPFGEMSWILENNKPMIKALKMMGAHPYKTYRLYERPL